MKPKDVNLDTLVQRVQETQKYSQISPDLIRFLVEKELAKDKNLKYVIKSTRNKLHQVGAAYQEKTIPYQSWLEELRQLPSSMEEEKVVLFLRKILADHSSTRERLPILSRFFTETLHDVAPVHTVLDVACGLNPLSIPWMPLAANFHYEACDIYQDMTKFLTSFFAHFNISGQAYTCDLTQRIPSKDYDLALVLKTIPCLEQIDREAGYRILHQLQTKNILVSFPARSLGGRFKGMIENYERHFVELTAGQSWKISRFEFPGELAFLIRK